MTFVILVVVYFPMDFDWDPEKNEQRLHKHGLDFTDSEDCFEHPLLVHEDTRRDYGDPDEWR